MGAGGEPHASRFVETIIIEFPARPIQEMRTADLFYE